MKSITPSTRTRVPTWLPAASSHWIVREILALPTAVVRPAAAATACRGVEGFWVAGVAQPARIPAATATRTMRRSLT